MELLIDAESSDSNSTGAGHATSSPGACSILCAGVVPTQAATKPLAVASIPPDFTAKNAVTGERIRLSEQHGRTVILTFWGTWCGPCRRELPILEKAQRKLGKDRLVVYAVSFRERPDILRVLRGNARSWNISLIEDRDGWIAGRYAVESIPRLFMIGWDGRVLASHLGYGDSTVDELVADLNRAPQQPKEAPASSEPASP